MSRQRVGTPVQTPPGRMSYQPVDWVTNDNLIGYQYARTGFNYIAPVSKYTEAYAMGPVMNGGEAYNVGNQPFNWRLGVRVGGTTPKQFNAQYSQAVNPPQYSSAGVYNSNTSTASILAGLAAMAQANRGGQ